MNIVDKLEWKENYLDAIILNISDINKNYSKQLLFALKPGGHIITINDKVKYHRNTIALEDMGFEIRDQIIWFFGDDSKSLCLGRKPLSEKTIVDNVIKWGTGGINIEGCRIGTEPISHGTSKMDIRGKLGDFHTRDRITVEDHITEGRFPANILFDETAAELLDEQSGILKGDSPNRGPRKMVSQPYFQLDSANMDRIGDNHKKYSGDGGASRFFYITKSNQDLIDYLTKLITPEKGTILIYTISCNENYTTINQ